MKVLRWILAGPCALLSAFLFGVYVVAFGPNSVRTECEGLDSVLIGAVLAGIVVFALVMPNPLRQRFWTWVTDSRRLLAAIGIGITLGVLIKACVWEIYDPLTPFGAALVAYGVMPTGTKTKG